MILRSPSFSQGGPVVFRNAYVVAIVIACVLIGGSARALDSSCGKNELMSATVGVAKAGNAAVRVSTFKTLAENWQFSLPELMREIEQIKRAAPSTWKPADLEWNITLTNTVKNILATYDQSIPLFRKCDDEAVIKPLVWASRGDDKDIRLNASNILANTVDNTTVCFVLHHLYQDRPELKDDGRANLLGITRAMASYAYLETTQAIEKVIPKVQQELGDRIKQLPQTAALLVNILARAAGSQNRTTRLPESLQRYCKGYDYEAQLD